MEKKDSWISTYHGGRFYAFEPKAEDIQIEDIAHALSLTCRYSGHCKFFFSVAQHSIGVSYILKWLGYDSKIQLYGLLHDASEAYVCDIPKDIKHNMPEYQRIEKKIQNAIWGTFGLEPPTDTIKAIIKQADNMMLLEEAKTLMLNWQEWDIPTYNSIRMHGKIEQIDMHIIEKQFLDTFDLLINR
jgi:5'-deoxynucleotidase YfbR-like HD superfamily hydrolase